jgi:hypothetical protein
MFRFTIRDVLWMMVVVGCFVGHRTAEAQTRSFKTGDRVYVRDRNRDGYGTVKRTVGPSYEIELENDPMHMRGRLVPRDSVYESFEHAQKRQLPQIDRPPVRDLSPLYISIGAAMPSCLLVVLLVLYVVNRRQKPPASTAIDAEVIP